MNRILSMKRVMLLVLMAGLVPGFVLAQDRDDRHGGGNGGHQGRANNRNANQRSQLLVANPQRSSIAFPGRGPGGVAIHANVFSRTNFSGNPVIQAHMSVINGGGFRAQIGIYNTNERVVGNYYWHNGNGFNYCHYYDRWGYHWYGWYLGNSYFWTRWYANNYWWYDPTYLRWCYWHDGGWWWQDPNSTSVYVYNNGSYLPSDGGANVNVNAGNGPGASSQPQAQGAGKTFFSNDGSREVKVVGTDAFLYDVSGQNTFKPLFLGSNVTSVKLSNTNNGKPLQVMLLYSDGSFGVFDAQGNPLNNGGSDSNNNYQSAPDQNNGAAQPPASGNNPPPASGNNTAPPMPAGSGN
jgi:hypothetical protein